MYTRFLLILILNLHEILNMKQYHVAFIKNKYFEDTFNFEYLWGEF